MALTPSCLSGNQVSKGKDDPNTETLLCRFSPILPVIKPIPPYQKSPSINLHIPIASDALNTNTTDTLYQPNNMDSISFRNNSRDYTEENNKNIHQISNKRNKYTSKITFEDVLNPFASYNKVNTMAIDQKLGQYSSTNITMTNRTHNGVTNDNNENDNEIVMGYNRNRNNNNRMDRIKNHTMYTTGDMNITNENRNRTAKYRMDITSNNNNAMYTMDEMITNKENRNGNNTDRMDMITNQSNNTSLYGNMNDRMYTSRGNDGMDTDRNVQTGYRNGIKNGMDRDRNNNGMDRHGNNNTIYTNKYNNTMDVDSYNNSTYGNVNNDDNISCCTEEGYWCYCTSSWTTYQCENCTEMDLQMPQEIDIQIQNNNSNNNMVTNKENRNGNNNDTMDRITNQSNNTFGTNRNTTMYGNRNDRMYTSTGNDAMDTNRNNKTMYTNGNDAMDTNRNNKTMYTNGSNNGMDRNRKNDTMDTHAKLIKNAKLSYSSIAHTYNSIIISLDHFALQNPLLIVNEDNKHYQKYIDMYSSVALSCNRIKLHNKQATVKLGLLGLKLIDKTKFNNYYKTISNEENNELRPEISTVSNKIKNGTDSILTSESLMNRDARPMFKHKYPIQIISNMNMNF
eukprot:290070_1